MTRANFVKKSEEVKNFFLSISTLDKRYEALIGMGRKLPLFLPHLKNGQNLVAGCQSRLYLSSSLVNGLVYFEAAADALISAGLAALLISVYSGESPETIVKEPPVFLDTIGIHASLTPGRSNGLSNIHLRMQKDALKFLTSQEIE